MTSPPLPFYFLNAFAPTFHSGNQAAVVFFDSASHPQSTDEQFMTLVARDFNFAETAYLIPLEGNGEGCVGKYGLRWFTPEEVRPIHAQCFQWKPIKSLSPGGSTLRTCHIGSISGGLLYQS